MQKIKVKCNLCLLILKWHLNKMTQIFVALVAWLMHLYTMGNMFLQLLFPGEFNRFCIFNKMATQEGLNFQIQLCLPKKGKNENSVSNTR